MNEEDVDYLIRLFDELPAEHRRSLVHDSFLRAFHFGVKVGGDRTLAAVTQQFERYRSDES